VIFVVNTFWFSLNLACQSELVTIFLLARQGQSHWWNGIMSGANHHRLPYLTVWSFTKIQLSREIS